MNSYRFIVMNFMVVVTGSVVLSASSHQTFNRLNWVEVTENNVCKQVMFDFAQPIHFKKDVIKEKSQLLLSFPGVSKSDFDVDSVMHEMEKLKNYGILKSVDVVEVDRVVPEMRLILTFSPSRVAKKVLNGQEVATNIKNQLTIKWSKVDNQKPNEPSYRLILDIFTKEMLDTLEQQTGILLQAHNNYVSKKKTLV